MQFELGQSLGKGTFSRVFAASTDAIAIKIAEPDFVDELKAEEELLRRLDHKNIIMLLGTTTIDGTPALILPRALYSAAHKERHMKERCVLPFMQQLFSGLAYLHSVGVAHCDVKPANILFMTHDDIVICDFGSAVLFDKDHRYCLTSYTYASPTCYSLSDSTGHVLQQQVKCDVWAAGVCCLSMLPCGRQWTVPSRDDDMYVWTVLSSNNDIFCSVTKSERLGRLLRDKVFRVDDDKRATAEECLHFLQQEQ